MRPFFHMSQPIMGSASGSMDGFFSQIGEGIAQGISRIGSDVLPIWAAQQLGLQKKDQLATKGVTFVPTQTQPADLSGSFKLDTGTMIALGVVAVVGIVVLLK